MTPRCLVLAKAPVAGLAKTRLGAVVGARAAAEVAAAALLDTLDACEAAFGPTQRRLALAGDLGQAERGEEITARLDAWQVIPQRGEGFAERLAHAHGDLGPGPVVQIGMDTPQVTGAHLAQAVAGLADHDAVLGRAEDGGWWVLALRDTAHASVLADVPTSTEETGDLTLAALRARGLGVGETAVLRDVDTAEDADIVARETPHGRFAATWDRVRRDATDDA